MSNPRKGTHRPTSDTGDAPPQSVTAFSVNPVVGVSVLAAFARENRHDSGVAATIGGFHAGARARGK